VNMMANGRGNELPYLIRKYETKPLRIYQEMSENEPNDYFGWYEGIPLQRIYKLELQYDLQIKMDNHSGFLRTDPS
jgi:hypothetical protein